MSASAQAHGRHRAVVVPGDWGAGTADESNVLGQIAAANPAFLMTTGDNEQNSGTQTQYGDLQGNGNVFGSAYLPRLGGGLPIFAAQGNHGFTSYAAYLANFPPDAIVAASGGRLSADTYANVGTLSSPTSSWSAPPPPRTSSWSHPPPTPSVAP